MNKERLIHAREIINNELSECLKELGTDWYHKLVLIRGDLDSLLKILNDTDSYEYRKRMFK